MAKNKEKAAKYSDCKHLQDFLRCETKLIRKHLDRHKWFQGIPDEGEGIRDFIEKYGWLIRELYCGYVCSERSNCKLAEAFRPEKKETED